MELLLKAFGVAQLYADCAKPLLAIVEGPQSSASPSERQKAKEDLKKLQIPAAEAWRAYEKTKEVSKGLKRVATAASHLLIDFPGH